MTEQQDTKDERERTSPDQGDGAPDRESAAAPDAEPTDSGAGAEAAEPEAEPALEERLDAAQAELDALNERHLRLAAEFDNFRKRTEREGTQQWARAQAKLATGLLDALDDLQRLADHEPEETTVDTLLEGAQLVEKKLRGALESAGLEPVEAEGERFDPEAMEALMTLPVDDPADDGVVADVLQRGYRFKDMLIRPARVRVKKYDE